jgi:hypothetical protein
LLGPQPFQDGFVSEFPPQHDFRHGVAVDRWRDSWWWIVAFSSAAAAPAAGLLAVEFLLSYGVPPSVAKQPRGL